MFAFYVFFFSSRRRHTRFSRDWSSDVCSSDLPWSGERTPLTEQGVDPRYGLVWHIPAGKAAAVPYLVDLREGARAADLAAAVREWRKAKPGVRLDEFAPAQQSTDDAVSLLKSELGARELTAEERLEHAIRTAA